MMEKKYFRTQQNFENAVKEMHAIKCTVYCACGATIGARVYGEENSIQTELIFCGKCYKEATLHERGE